MKFELSWLVVIFFKLQIIFVSATNYCDPKLCSGSRHVACGNSGVCVERIFALSLSLSATLN